MQNLEAIYQEATRIIHEESARIPGCPILYTSCQKHHVDAFVSDSDYHDSILTTDAGKKLQALDLFKSMPYSVAYSFWGYLTTRFVLENNFAETTTLMGDLANHASLAFGIEIPMLYHAKPEVQAIEHRQTGIIIPREKWLQEGLIRPHVVGYLNNVSGDVSKAELALVEKFKRMAFDATIPYSPLAIEAENTNKRLIHGIMHGQGRIPLTFQTIRNT